MTKADPKTSAKKPLSSTAPFTNMSPEEMREFFLNVAKRANAMQRETVAKAKKIREAEAKKKQ